MIKWRSPTGEIVERSIIALDIDGSEDPEKDGEVTIRAFEAAHQPLPPTMTFKSGRVVPGRDIGGRHLIYLVPMDWNGAFKRNLGAGVDIKLGGIGYIAAPGSLHKSGQYYDFLGNAPLAEAPLWLLAEISRPIEEKTGGAPSAALGDPFEPGSMLSNALHGISWQETEDGDLEAIEAAVIALDPDYDHRLRGQRKFMSPDVFKEVHWSIRALQDWFAHDQRVSGIAFAHAHQFAGHDEQRYFATLWNYRRPNGREFGRGHLFKAADRARPGWRGKLSDAGKRAARRLHDDGSPVEVPSWVSAGAGQAARPVSPEGAFKQSEAPAAGGYAPAASEKQQPDGVAPPLEKQVRIRSHGEHHIAGATEALSASNPRHSATIFRTMHYPFLIYMNQDWLTWDGAAYITVSHEILASDVSAFLANSHTRRKQEAKPNPSGAPGEPEWVDTPFRPEPKHVNAVIEFLRHICTESEELSGGPKWLKNTGRMAPASEYISFRNGILHIWSGQFQPPSPWLFTRNALDFNYDPHAPEPARFHQFRREIWVEDAECEEFSTSLQEWLGFTIASVPNIQNILLALGTSGGGKGTVLRLMALLSGKYNVGSATSKSLTSDFGLQAFVGKRLMLLPDLNIGKKTDKDDLKTLLLNISGKDQVPIMRKFKDTLHETLDCMIVIAANGIPEIPDAAGALIRRYVPIRFRQSFSENPDTDLNEKFRAELPGIFLWALEGLKRVLRNKRFTLGPLAKEELGEIKREGAPIHEFLEDMCDIAPAGKETLFETTRDIFFAQYKAWRGLQGLSESFNRAWAVRNLKDALGASFGKIGDDRRNGRFTGFKMKSS
jgi:putative DNA primase/helicase